MEKGAFGKGESKAEVPVPVQAQAPSGTKEDDGALQQAKAAAAYINGGGEMDQEERCGNIASFYL